MGKMDTSDLSERFFDENTILYSVENRNKILFGEKDEKKEETITFTPGPGVTASVHEQNDQNIEENTEDGEAVSEDSNSDSDEQTLIALWRTYKESNPEGTLDDFYKDVSGTNSEVE
jgi:hypothetical protein